MQGIKHSFGNDSKSSHPNAEMSRNPCEKHLDKLNFIQIYDIKT